MAKEEGGAFDAEALKQQPVYSLLHGGAGGAAAFAGASPEPGELPRLLLPGDRVVVNLADPAVYSDGELHGAMPELRQADAPLGRGRDPALEQHLMDHMIAERFSRRAPSMHTRLPSARGADEGEAGEAADGAASGGARWEPCTVIGSSRDMLAMLTNEGAKVYILSSTMQPVKKKAFADTKTIFRCQACSARMRVPKPCDVLICFKCKAKVDPPRALVSMPRRSLGTGIANLPLKPVVAKSEDDFIGNLQPEMKVEVQVVYKHAHRVAGRAWVMATVVARESWNDAGDVLQLRVPYPTPQKNAPNPVNRAGFMYADSAPRGGVGARGGAAGGAGGAGGADGVGAGSADDGPTLTLPAGNRFGSATVELPALDAPITPDKQPDPVLAYVSSDLTPLLDRAMLCQQLAKQRPHDLAEMHVLVSDPPSPPGMFGSTGMAADSLGTAPMLRVRSMRTALVLSYVPGLRKHVVAYSQAEVKLLDLTSACFVVEPSTTRVHHASVLCKPGTHIKECPVCFEPFDTSSLGMRTSSCHPRHCCNSCLCAWAEGQIKEGKLYVRCPAEGCKRHMELVQLKQIVNRKLYTTLVTSIREVHREAARAEQKVLTEGTEEEQKAFKQWTQNKDVRYCIGCFARIEKNKGCSHMTCWRCGTEFQWESAPPVSAGLPEAAAAAAAGTLDDPFRGQHNVLGGGGGGASRLYRAPQRIRQRLGDAGGDDFGAFGGAAGAAGRVASQAAPRPRAALAAPRRSEPVSSAGVADGFRRVERKERLSRDVPAAGGTDRLDQLTSAKRPKTNGSSRPRAVSLMPAGVPRTVSSGGPRRSAFLSSIPEAADEPDWVNDVAAREPRERDDQPSLFARVAQPTSDDTGTTGATQPKRQAGAQEPAPSAKRVRRQVKQPASAGEEAAPPAPRETRRLTRQSARDAAEKVAPKLHM